MKNKPAKLEYEIGNFIDNSIDNQDNTIDQFKKLKSALLAKKIEEAMTERAWPRLLFAQKMNVQPSIITRWLSGTHNFTIDTLFEIEHVLGIKLLSIEEPIMKSSSFYLKVNNPHIKSNDSANLINMLDEVIEYFGENYNSTSTTPLENNSNINTHLSSF